MIKKLLVEIVDFFRKDKIYNFAENRTEVRIIAKTILKAMAILEVSNLIEKDWSNVTFVETEGIPCEEKN